MLCLWGVGGGQVTTPKTSLPPPPQHTSLPGAYYLYNSVKLANRWKVGRRGLVCVFTPPD